MLALVLFSVCMGLGWMIGGTERVEGRARVTTLSPLSRALNVISFGGASYVCSAISEPEGALIQVDGRDLGVVAPVEIELAPGEHRILFSMPHLGGSSFKVTGAARDRIVLAPLLSGSVVVNQPGNARPIEVAVDGVFQGWAPIRIDRLRPGFHQVQLAGTGQPPQNQTVPVRIGQATEVVARTIDAPSSGVIVVRAGLASDEGSEPLEGAGVWVDGAFCGRTPLTLRLPSGPHSIRVTHGAESSQVQMIDLPGGNKRFARFQFGGTQDETRLTATTLKPSGKGPVRLKISMSGVREHDVVGVWLHVLDDNQRWCRLPVPIHATHGGVTGILAFPTQGPDAIKRTPYYASALRTTGEEYFTELSPGRRASRPLPVTLEVN